MGEYADEALERDLADYWASLEDDPSDWPVAGRARPMGRGHTSNPRPTNQELFEGFAGSFEDLPTEVDKPIDYSQF